MKKIRLWFRAVFGFNRKEINGFLFITGILLLTLVATVFSEDIISSEPTLYKDQAILDSLLSSIEIEEEKSHPVYTNEQKPEINYFSFDPNTITEEQWVSLGVYEKLAQRIRNYVSKGGSFRTNKDLLKIYGFPEAIYVKLEPYITIEKKNFTKKDYKTEKKYKEYEKKEYPKYEKKQVEPFDINSATEEQLVQVKGIGSYWAGRIIKFRDALGGIATTDQLYEVYNIDKEVVDELTKYASVEENLTIHQLSVNTSTIDELKKHPYISYKVANSIEAYRHQHGDYQDLTEIKKLHLIDEALYNKLVPYLKL